MSDDPLQTARRLLLAESLRPLVKNIERHLVQRVTPSGQVFVAKQAIPRSLDRLAELMRELGKSVDDLEFDVMSNEMATGEDVRRATKRIERCIDALGAEYLAVRTCHGYGQEAVACDLLAGAYRHTMRELEAWFIHLIRTLSDPIAECAKRGMPTEGNVVLHVPLNLTAAPELARLSRWLVARRFEASEARNRSFGARVRRTAGKLLIAWGILDLL